MLSDISPARWPSKRVMEAYGSVLRQTQCRKLPWLISGPPHAAQLSTDAELAIIALVCEVMDEPAFDMHLLIIAMERSNVMLNAFPE